MSTNASPVISVAYGDPAGLPVSLGVPFPARMLKEGMPLSVVAPNGEVRPAGGRPLAWWPDGSVRWGLVTFTAPAAGDYRLQIGTAAPAGPQTALARAGDRWIITSDRLRVAVCETGPGVLDELVCDGHAYLAAPADLALCVDDASTRHEAQRSVRVLEETAQRVRLRVEGAHRRPDGTRCLNYRLDVEVWAGWPAVRLDYHYFHLEPGQPEQRITRIALDTAWNLGAETRRHFLQMNYGLFYVSRHVFNPAPVALAADFSRESAHVEDPAMLLDDVDYPFYLHAPLVNTQDWLGVRDADRAVYLQMQDFTAARPNRLTSAENRLAAEVWPSTAGTLELPQGRSRRQTLTLAFVAHQEVGARTAKLSNAPIQAPTGVAGILNAPVYEGRACVNPAWIAACGAFEQQHVLPLGQHVRIEGNLTGLMRLDFPVTKFDVGDTNSHYNSSYAWIDGSLVPHLDGAPTMPRVFPGGQPTQTYLDCHEPVWTNNEYDVIHAFSGELMRTGRVDLWRTLRLAARHNIEVDFLHYSDHRWLHRATPAHSARHTTTGAYPSHFWTQGLLEYYCLSGDVDALEVALALGDKTMENFADPELRPVLWGFNREIGWSILALAHLYDITREARFKPVLDEMVDAMVAFDRVGYTGAVNLSGGNDRQNLNRQVVGNFFGYSSMVDGIDLYADITGRADVIAWLQQFCHDLVDEALNAAREGHMPGINFSTALNVGFERTGDLRFIHFMQLLLDQLYWNARGVDGGASVKPVASIYRSFTRLLGHAWRHGLLDAYEYPAVRALEQAPRA